MAKTTESTVDYNSTITMKDLKDLLTNKSKYKVSEENGHIGISNNAYRYESGVEGEYNERFVYYRHPNMPVNLFIREIYRTDSYGNSESLEKIDMVEGKEETITVYKPI